MKNLEFDDLDAVENLGGGSNALILSSHKLDLESLKSPCQRYVEHHDYGNECQPCKGGQSKSVEQDDRCNSKLKWCRPDLVEIPSILAKPVAIH